MFRIFLILAFVPGLALADLGDTLEQARLKYGEPSVTGNPHILSYVSDKYRIWQTYDDKGLCIIADYSPLSPESLTGEELRELDHHNLPGLVPGVGPGWAVVSWADTADCRGTLSFQYTAPSPSGTGDYQVITCQQRREGIWHYSRICLSAEGIAFFKSLRTGDTAAPVYKTYKLRNGKEVAMSASQFAITNKEWHALAPEKIAALAAGITVTIRVEKNDGTQTLATGFFINDWDVLTNWHVVRDAANITVIVGDGHQCNAQLKVSKPQVDLATLTVLPCVFSTIWAHFDSDSDWEQIDERVYVYGNPKGMEGTFSEGMLSAWRANGAIMQISAPIDQGSSGSPVFNQYGLVIGIVREKIVSSAELNFAVSSNAIYEALGLKTDDHPDGFDLRLTQGLELERGNDQDAPTTP